DPPDSKLFYTIDGSQEVYFPWVGNNDDFGLGEADSSITLQNLTMDAGYVYIYYGTGSGWTFATSAYLESAASKTFTADMLGIPAPGAPVIAGLYDPFLTDDSGEVCEWEIGQDVSYDGDLDDCFEYETETLIYEPLELAGVVK